MMMPANFSVVNAEMVYGGAGVGDYLPNAWKAENVKQFNTNIITILSNSFVQVVINRTLGTMFGGDWSKDGDTLFGDDGSLSTFFKYKDGNSGEEMNALNKIMRGIGTAAAIYSLGTSGVKSVHDADMALGADGTVWYDWS